jgi:hypothetical protein
MDSKLYINPPLVDRVYHWEGKKQPRTRKELDAFFKSAPIRKVKQDICEMGRRIYAKGYTDGNGGNLSVRVGEEIFTVGSPLRIRVEEADISRRRVSFSLVTKG